MKKALITGITGQDGSYLADLLIEKGYEVHGIIRRASSFNTSRIDHLYQDPHISGVRLFLHHGDLCDSLNLTRLIDRIGPEEIYHLGAQSHVRVSYDIPENTGDITALVLDRPRHAELIAACRRVGASVRLITDGDVAGVIFTAQADQTGVDIYFGTGGAPEGVLAAGARIAGGLSETEAQVLAAIDQRLHAAGLC